jgi:protein-S-isoprenylcysteine O-methyltransferase Ste14
MKIFKGIILGIIIIIIGVGLPIMGWGIKNIDSYFENPYRISLLIIIIIQGIIIGIESIQDQTKNAINKGRKDRYNNIQSLVPVINRLITLFIFFFAAYCDKNNYIVMNDNFLIRLLGIIVYSLGIIITAFAHNELGKYHSIEVTIQNDHKLVQIGLYKYIRNPIYLGMILSFLGYGMIFRSLICISLIVIIIGLFIWRIYAEEKVLKKEFGKEWTDYQNKTWRLIPYLY